MKTYTDLKESKKLAEILPIESADMHYARIEDDDEMRDWTVYLSPIPKICAVYVENLPCWSLAALMEEMNRNGWKISLECCGAEFTAKFDDGETFVMQYADNAIDTFYKMVVALHEKKML